jgi:hypothetical protein
MQEVTKGLVLMDKEEQLYTKIVSSRRKIELGLFKFQMRQSNCHIIDKVWYDKWVNFITGNVLNVLQLLLFVTPFSRK